MIERSWLERLNDDDDDDDDGDDHDHDDDDDRTSGVATVATTQEQQEFGVGVPNRTKKTKSDGSVRCGSVVGAVR